MPKMYFDEQIVAKWVFTFLHTTEIYNKQKTVTENVIWFVITVIRLKDSKHVVDFAMLLMILTSREVTRLTFFIQVETISFSFFLKKTE